VAEHYMDPDNWQYGPPEKLSPRKKAWVTRRVRYGPSGHRGSYSRGAAKCAGCNRMRDGLLRLHLEGSLTEGQTARLTGLGRVQVRAWIDAAREGEKGGTET
jgi:hypothetical protein